MDPVAAAELQEHGPVGEVPHGEQEGEHRDDGRDGKGGPAARTSESDGILTV